MATLLTTTIHDPDEGHGKNWKIEVTDTFDQVMDKVHPLNQPNSAIEARGNCIYLGTDDKRIYMPPNFIIAVEEDTEL